MTHICVSKLIIIGSDNGLPPGRRQAIIWNNAGILFIGPLGTNFNEIVIKIRAFSFKKMHLKMSSGKRRSFCLGLNVLSWHLDVAADNTNVFRHSKDVTWVLLVATTGHQRKVFAFYDSIMQNWQGRLFISLCAWQRPGLGWFMMIFVAVSAVFHARSNKDNK